MKKAITKVTAFSLIATVAIQALPMNVYATSCLPAAGIAASTGVGSSINDIKAQKARAEAKMASANVHTKITVPADVALSNGDNEVAVTASNNDPKVAVSKVDTPSSSAVSSLNDSSKEAGAKTATIEVTNTEKVSDDGAVKVNTASSDAIAEAGGDNDDKTVVTVSEETVTPEIEIKPEHADVADGEEDLTGTVIAQCDGYVNVRAEANEDGEVVGKLYNHSAGEWLGKEGDWYKISSGNVVGYVKGEYVVTGQAAVKLASEVGIRTATVHTTTLKIREDASAESTVLGLVANNDKLTVVEETDEWVKVSIEEGDGWVSKEYVSITTEFPEAESKAEEEARLKKEEAERQKANAAAKKASQKSSGSSSGSKKTSGGGGSYSAGGSGLGSSVANYGLQFVGNPYVYGGTSLTNGTDCSGFTMGVYKNFGVSLPHSSGAQRSVGYAVGSLAEAQPGDILCYSGHVAIYIGGGQIVHASTAKTGIKVSNADYRPILAIRRIF